MMYRALVESILDIYHVRVRIPNLNKAEFAVGSTPTSELATAVIATLPGINPALKIGDAVIVDFETDDLSKPIVVGLLFNKNLQKNVSDIKASSLEVTVDTKLTEDTTIGKVTPESLKCLISLDRNVETEFGKIDSKFVDLKTSVQNITRKIEESTIADDVKNLQTQVSTNIKTINNIQQDISSIENELEDKLEEPLILSQNISYGTSSPTSITNPKEGQLYFQIM